MTGAPWIILHNEWMRPQVVKEGGRVWSGPLVGHLICVCSEQTLFGEMIWGLLLMVIRFRGKVHAPPPHPCPSQSLLSIPLGTLVSPWIGTWPRPSQSVSLLTFFKLELKRDIPFSLIREPEDVHPRQLCLLRSRRKLVWEDNANRKRFKGRRRWESLTDQGPADTSFPRRNCSSSNLWANTGFAHK